MLFLSLKKKKKKSRWFFVSFFICSASQTSNQAPLASMIKNVFLFVWFFWNGKGELSWIFWFFHKAGPQNMAVLFFADNFSLLCFFWQPKVQLGCCLQGLWRNTGLSILWEIPWCWEFFRQWNYNPDFWTMHLAMNFQFFSQPEKVKMWLKLQRGWKGMMATF